VPVGEGWPHEVKFEGNRVQAHKAGLRVIVYSHNGHDFTDGSLLSQLLRELPVKAAVLEGEAEVRISPERTCVEQGRAQSTYGRLTFWLSMGGMSARSRC
jgi:ATP-dependent DNA ligase